MSRRAPLLNDQLLFEWPETTASGCDAEPDDPSAVYPLQGPNRFQWLPLELPPKFTFYLGTHHAGDLALSPDPLFLSRRALVLHAATKKSTPEDWPRMDRQRRTLPRALAPWAIDSAGFTELHQFGCHHVPARQYAAEVCRYAAEIGNLQFAAVQDWMCEPSVLAITRQDIATHQRKTIESYLELQEIAPHLPWAPVLQGFLPGDHERHLALYYRQGIDLRCARTVGVGSVCRRQGMVEADQIVRELSGADLKLHIFGYKLTGLPNTLRYVASADSMAWSLAARKQGIQMPGHDHSGAATGELWQRGPTTAYLQQHEGGWKILWDSANKGSLERVASRDSGRVALSRAGYALVRKLWTCANCLVWARTWRNNMLALALAAARPDMADRGYGYRTMTAAELAAFRSLDPAEGHDPRDQTVRDYEHARRRLGRLAGVRIPRARQCPAPIPSPPCAPARYLPDNAPPPRWAPPPRVVVEPLAPGTDQRPWRTRRPGHSLLDPHGPDEFDVGRLDALAEGAVEAVWDDAILAEMAFWPAEAVHRRFLAESEERLPQTSEFSRFLAYVRGLPARARPRARAAFEEAFEAALWERCVTEVPEADAQRPVNASRQPWHRLFGA